MQNENQAVARLSESFALSLGYPPYQARQIHNAAALHDIGKVLIPSSILNKSGKLTPDEFEIVKLHTKLGAQLLSGVPGTFGKLARQVCALHHEWENGKGYWGIPLGRLPRYISIIAIVDVWVALLSTRPYKAPWPPEEAIEYLRGQVGTQFCPKLVDEFIRFARLNRLNKELISCEQK